MKRPALPLLIVAIALLSHGIAGAADKKVKILLAYTKPDHPYASHMYEFESRLLAKCLMQTPGVQAIVVQDWPEDEGALTGVSSIVYYSRPAGDIVLHPSRRDKFQQLMKDGVGLTCIHWATGSNKDNAADWLEALGGWFQRPPCGLKTTTSLLVQPDPKHPICRGWEGHELRDEFYLDLRFHKETKPIMVVEVDGKKQTVGWAFERNGNNNGRSFGTTLGHFHDNFTREPFRRAIVNGILWTAHVEVPEKGAPVKLTEKDWTLPPKK